MPSVEYAHKFITVLEQVYAKLKDRILFEPHIVTFASKSPEFSAHNCVSGGAYCAFEPHAESSASGRDVLLEGLRQKCVYKASVPEYFTYMDAFFKDCAKVMSEECSRKALRKTRLDWAQVQKCVADSFHGVKDIAFLNDNEVLADEREKFKKLGTASFPNIFINNVLYKGSLSHFDVLLSLCSALHDETEECRNLDFDSADDISILHLVAAHFLIFFFGILVLAYVCRRIAKRQYLRDLNKAVDKYVTEYSAIKEDTKIA